MNEEKELKEIIYKPTEKKKDDEMIEGKYEKDNLTKLSEKTLRIITNIFISFGITLLLITVVFQDMLAVTAYSVIGFICVVVGIMIGLL